MKLHFLFLFFLLIANSLNAQSSYDNKQKAKQLIEEKNKATNDSVKVEMLLEISELLPEDSAERLSYMIEGLEIAEKNNMFEKMGLFHFDMAWYYFFYNDKENTIANFLKVIEYSTDDEILVFSYGCLSNSYSWDGKHDLALEYAQKSYEIADKSPNKDLRTDAMLFMGDAYSSQGNNALAKVYYLRAFDNLRLTKNVGSILYVVLNMHLGDIKWIEQYTQFRFGMKVKQMYEESSPRKKRIFVYYIIKAANSSVSTTESVEIQTIELQNQRKQLVLYAIIILFLLIIAILSIIQVQMKRKANEKLAKANEIKSHIFVILNHDLRQPIASLISYLQLKATHPEAISPEEALVFDQKTIDTANNVFTSMENLLVWAKDQMHAFAIDFKPVSIEEIFEDVQSFFKYEDLSKLKFEITEHISLTTDENYLKTIMRNLTLNAIAASEDAPGSVITWKAKKEKEKIVLSIHNFGKEITQDKIDLLFTDNKGKLSSDGTGLIIVKSLAKSINCKIEVETESNKGTTFYLIFKN